MSSATEGIINTIIMNFIRENQLRFETIRGAKIEDEVECETEKRTIKSVREGGNKPKKSFCRS